MKTALIPVDPLDDLAALKDKIAWAKAPRALLLWPAEGCAIQRTLDFVRLHREADALGAQIAIVSRKRAVRREAQAAGIPVFTDRKAATQKAWRWRRIRAPKRRRRAIGLRTLHRLAHRPPPWNNLSPAQRLLAFTAGVLATLLLAAFTLPGAHITLTPAFTTRETAITARISPAYPQVTADGRLPARWESVTVGASDEKAVSGVTYLPAAPAQVSLTVTNLTDRAVEIPRGTRVHAYNANIAFVTTTAARLPAQAGATAKIEATALTPGRQGNLPSHHVGYLEAPLTFQAVADNPLPAHGGRDILVPAPSADDYQSLEARLQARLQAEALAALQKRFPNAWIVLPSLQPQSELEHTFTPPKSAPANFLRLTLRVRFHALVVSKSDMLALAQTVLAPKAPSGMQLAVSSIHIHTGAAEAATGGIYRWHLELQGAFFKPWRAETVQQLAAGHSPAAARQRLEARLPLASPPKIRTWPSWWPLLPWFPLRIAVSTTPLN